MHKEKRCDIMLKKKCMMITAMMIFSVLFGSLSYTRVVEASPTTIFYVDPPSIVNPALTPGNTFTVDVEVSDASYLYAYQVYMTWDGAVLEYDSHVFGGFLADQPEGSATAQRIEPDWVLVGEQTLGQYAGKSAAEGLLFSITFVVLTSGETDLAIDHATFTYYIEVFSPPQQEKITDFPKENGYFSNFTGGQPPVASFDYSRIEPQVGVIVTFNASASYDPDGIIVNYMWDFGDETTSTGMIVTHVYTIAGVYTVTLSVTDDDGLATIAKKSITIGKLSSTISISASPTTIMIGEITTVGGAITPTRVEAIVTVWYRLSEEEPWNFLTTAITDEHSQYIYTWMPLGTGTYELEASWEGDMNTRPAESSTVTVDVVLPHVLAIKLSGEHDYLFMESVKIRLAALVKEAITLEPVSNANVTIEIYDPNGKLWVSDMMVEKLLGTGIYEWESEDTIQRLHLEKGVYLACVNASLEGTIMANDVLQFHIDPLAEQPIQLHLILLFILATALTVSISVWFADHRKLSRKLSEMQKIAY